MKFRLSLVLGMPSSCISLNQYVKKDVLHNGILIVNLVN